MKALFKARGKRVELREVPVPKPGDGELLVKMKACGICGTDIEKVVGETATTRLLGHEVVGEIAEVGERVEDLHLGDRVFVHHHVSCGKCHHCLQGSATMCRSFVATAIDPCGFSEYFRVPKVNIDRGAVLELPGSVCFEEATFVEPLACCLRALNRCNVKAGCSVAVVGCGPMGLLHIKALTVLGASTILGIDFLKPRLNFAKKMGADLVIDANRKEVEGIVKNAVGGRGVDLVVLATSSAKAFREAFKLARRGGLICVFGASSKNVETTMSFGRIFYDELSIVPSYSTTEVETNEALKLIESKRVGVMDLVTHRYDLTEAAEAFQTAMSSVESLKVLITSG